MTNTVSTVTILYLQKVIDLRIPSDVFICLLRLFVYVHYTVRARVAEQSRTDFHDLTTMISMQTKG